ncbi:MAG: hypothetical protein ABSC55_28205 [Syntrophorhabdales bacterium]
MKRSAFDRWMDGHRIDNGALAKMVDDVLCRLAEKNRKKLK